MGPINPLLYHVLGPAGPADGIVDVVSGNNSVTDGSTVIVPGFTASTGFDVASGWGTINAARFVPSLVAATQLAHQDAAVRQVALSALQRGSIRLSAVSVPPGGTSYLQAGGLPHSRTAAAGSAGLRLPRGAGPRSRARKSGSLIACRPVSATLATSAGVSAGDPAAAGGAGAISAAVTGGR